MCDGVKSDLPPETFSILILYSLWKLARALSFFLEILPGRDFALAAHPYLSLSGSSPTSISWAIHGHGRVVPGLRNQSQHGYIVVAFSGCFMHIQKGWTMEMPFHYSTSLLDNNCLFAAAIPFVSKCVCK